MKRKIIISTMSILIIILTSIMIYSLFTYDGGNKENNPDTNPNYYSIGTNDIGPSDNVEEVDGVRRNIAKGMKESKIDSDLEISNVEIISNLNNPEVVTITFNLKNIGVVDLEKFFISIDFIDQYNTNLNSISFDIQSIKSGENITITRDTNLRIIDSNQYKFRKVASGGAG